MTQFLAPLAPGQVAQPANTSLHPNCYASVTSAPDFNATVSAHIQAVSGCFGELSNETGMGYDTIRNRIILMSQGGHQEYFGNEIYAFDLGALTWKRLTTPSDTSQMNLPNWCVGGANFWCGGDFPEGTNISTHTYGDVIFIPTMGSTGTVMLFNAGGTFNSTGCQGAFNPNPVAGATAPSSCNFSGEFYDFSFEKSLPNLSGCPIPTNPTVISNAIWPCNDGAGANAPLPNGNGWFYVATPTNSAHIVGFIAQSSAAYDPVSNKVYRTFSGTSSLTQGQWISAFDPTVSPTSNGFSNPPATGSSTSPPLDGGIINNRNMVGAIWGTHQQWWFFGGRGSGTAPDTGLGVINLPNGDSHEITPNTGACPGINCYPNDASDRGTCDVGYFSPRDQIMIWCGGQTMYFFDPSLTGPTARLFTAVTLTGVALPNVNIGSARGGYSRIAYDAVHSCIVILYGDTDNLFVFKPPSF